MNAETQLLRAAATALTNAVRLRAQEMPEEIERLSALLESGRAWPVMIVDPAKKTISCAWQIDDGQLIVFASIPCVEKIENTH